jgi:hypothetical protein
MGARKTKGLIGIRGIGARKTKGPALLVFLLLYF